MRRRLATIIRLRDESKSISSEQADKMIADAKRQRDGIVKRQKKQENRPVDKIFSMNKDLKNNVNSNNRKNNRILIKIIWSGWESKKPSI